MKALNIHHFVKETEVLGPGKRSVIWVSGCDKHCEGCLAVHFENESEKISVEELSKMLLSVENIEGVTISGGEPFLQAEALAEVMDRVKAVRPDYTAVIYTGYTIEQLQEKARADVGIKKLMEHSDIIIDGPYIKELDDGKPYRGSSNQRIIFTSERYRDCDYYSSVQTRRMEIIIDQSGIKMVGVPNASQLEAWNNIKNKFRNK